jgi:hypothetical protein
MVLKCTLFHLGKDINYKCLKSDKENMWTKREQSRALHNEILRDL